MKYYIKERDNPQLGINYYPMGKMSKKDAKRYEQSIYGFNTMLAYDTEKEYLKAVKLLCNRNVDK